MKCNINVILSETIPETLETTELQRKYKNKRALTIYNQNVIIQTINILEGDINDLLDRYFKLKVKYI